MFTKENEESSQKTEGLTLTTTRKFNWSDQLISCDRGFFFSAKEVILRPHIHTTEVKLKAVINVLNELMTIEESRLK